MPNPTRSQLERDALKAFRGSKAGRILANVKRQVESGKADIAYLKRQSRALSAATGLSTARELMHAMGLGDEYDAIERYAGPNFRNKLASWLGKSLGKPGKLIGSFLRGGKQVGAQKIKPTDKEAAEFEVAANLLRAAGYQVFPPQPAGKGLPGWKGLSPENQEILNKALEKQAELTAEEHRLTEEMLRKINKPIKQGMFEEFEGEETREEIRAPGRMGAAKQFIAPPQMIEVSSSNVHSIGFQPITGNEGTLFVRYLADLGNGVRSGPGALYEYLRVPTQLWTRFVMASSKGEFVWDHLRVRGTVAGFQYAYNLAGITGGYVPRRATATHQHIPGHGVGVQQMFVKRSFQQLFIEKGIESSRSQQLVGGRKTFKNMKAYQKQFFTRKKIR